jgi:hypothetical protein
MNYLSKAAGYKINIQKTIAFLSTNNEQTEKEIREIIPLTITLKIIMYLGINLVMETKDLFNEKYKSLRKLKETSEDGKISSACGSLE